MDRPRRALYGPSVSSWFQTRLADGLTAILSGNAPKVKQYFMGRFSRSNFYGTILFAPITYITAVQPLVPYLNKNSRFYVRTKFNNAHEGSIALCKSL